MEMIRGQKDMFSHKYPQLFFQKLQKAINFVQANTSDSLKILPYQQKSVV